MAEAFSREIHEYLNERIQLCEAGKSDAAKAGNTIEQSYFEGKLLELYFFRQYLTDNIDLKNSKYY